MILNAIEKALMNNPVRSTFQRHYEAPILEELGGRVEGGRVLEIGCAAALERRSSCQPAWVPLCGVS